MVIVIEIIEITLYIVMSLKSLSDPTRGVSIYFTHMVYSIWGVEEVLARAIPFRIVIGAQVAKVILPCLLCRYVLSTV